MIKTCILLVTSSKEGSPSGKSDEFFSVLFFPEPGSDITRLRELVTFGSSGAKAT